MAERVSSRPPGSRKGEVVSLAEYRRRRAQAAVLSRALESRNRPLLQDRIEELLARFTRPPVREG